MRKYLIKYKEYEPIVKALEFYIKKNCSGRYNQLIGTYVESLYINATGQTPQKVLRNIKEFYPEHIRRVKEVLDSVPELLRESEEASSRYSNMSSIQRLKKNGLDRVTTY